MTQPLMAILVERNGYNAIEAQDLIEEARDAVTQGTEDPSNVLEDFFGLEVEGALC